MRLIAIPTLQAVPPGDWDRLGDPNHPFMEHAFLAGMEASETVGKGTGWVPLYLLVVSDFDADAHRELTADNPRAYPQEARLFGAAAAYVKTDSFGEFIFDWGWASFFHRHGVPYYPKIVVAAPFTPATGPRLLIDPDLDAAEQQRVSQMLGEGLIALAQQIDATSVHWLFAPQTQVEQLAQVGYRHRVTVQHAWVNDGYADFDAFLATMKSRNRKSIRRERRLAQEHGLDIGVYRGTDMDAEQWAAVHRFYHRGCYRYGSTPYLSDAFFTWLQTHFADRVLCSMAREKTADGTHRWVAATLNFQRGTHLYGRYWGCEREYYALHFEMAFYRLIEHCIEQGWTRFEAGAGGRHKIKRGLEPVCIHSAHWIAQPQLGAAIYAHIDEESQQMRIHRDELGKRSTKRQQTM